MGGGFQGILAFGRSKAGLSVGAALSALVIAGGGFWAGRATAPVPAPSHRTVLADASGAEDSDGDDMPAADGQTASYTTAPESAAAGRTRGHRGGDAGSAIIAAATKASGAMYVHRNNSDLRKAPSYASETIKKEPKGAKLEMVALSDKWAEVDDGGIKGWMRASVLKDTPPDAPGTKRSRKKKADDGDDATSGD